MKEKVEIVIVARSDEKAYLEAFAAGLLDILKHPPTGIDVDPIETRFRFQYDDPEVM